MKVLSFFVSLLISVSSFAQDSTQGSAESATAGANSSVSATQSEAPELVFPSKESLEAKPFYWLCRASTVVRTLKITFKNGTCRVFYSKDGVEKDSGQSKDLEKCFAVFKGIKKNLEENKWVCRDISDVPVLVNE